MVQQQNDYRLTPAQVEQFHREGFLTGLTACSQEQMARYRSHLDQMLTTPGPDGGPCVHNRHLDDAVMDELIRLPAIVAPITSILGQDLLLWRAHFWNKKPGDCEIPWHQDRAYWPLEPEVVVSAWIAIDDVNIENSCVQIVPGTHRKVLNLVKSPEGVEFKEMADTAGVDLSQKVDIVLRPGQFMLFTERTLHRSVANVSNRRRLGLALRVIPPLVRVLKYDSPAHGVVPLSGRDTLGFSRVGRKLFEETPACSPAAVVP